MNLRVSLWMSTMLAGWAETIVRSHLPGHRRVTVANDTAPAPPLSVA